MNLVNLFYFSLFEISLFSALRIGCSWMEMTEVYLNICIGKARLWVIQVSIPDLLHR